MDNKETAIQELTKLLHELMTADTVGLEFKDAGEITINGYKSQGYSKAGTFEGVKDVHLKNQNHIAPLQTDTVQNLIESIVLILHEEDQPEPTKLKKAIQTISSLGGFANLAAKILEILTKYGVL